MTPRPPSSTLFPYTTLFRSKQVTALGPVQNPGQPAAWSVYIATEDAAATAKKVREAGGTVALEPMDVRSEEHTSELQSPDHLVCRLLLEKKNTNGQRDLVPH